MTETPASLVNLAQGVSLATTATLVPLVSLDHQDPEELREKKVREVLLESLDHLDPLDLREKVLDSIQPP